MNLATEGCYINKEMIKRLDEIHKIGENPELLDVKKEGQKFGELIHEKVKASMEVVE